MRCQAGRVAPRIGDSVCVEVMRPEEKATELDPIQQAARDQFARQSALYGKSHILADVGDVEAALQHISLPARARVLDVATGAGHTGLYLASLGHDVTLSDLAQPMLDRVAESAAARGLTVQLRQHPAEALPYDEGSFDLVTCRVGAAPFQCARRVRPRSGARARSWWLVSVDRWDGPG